MPCSSRSTVVEIVREREEPVRRVASVHLALDRRLELAWLRDRILELPRADLWQTLARAALRDDLYKTHRALTSAVLERLPPLSNDDAAIDAWVQATPQQSSVNLGNARRHPGSSWTRLDNPVRRSPRARQPDPAEQ